MRKGEAERSGRRGFSKLVPVSSRPYLPEPQTLGMRVGDENGGSRRGGREGREGRRGFTNSARLLCFGWYEGQKGEEVMEAKKYRTESD